MGPGSCDGFGLDVLPGGDRDVGDPPALAPDLAFGVGVAKLSGAPVTIKKQIAAESGHENDDDLTMGLWR